MFVRVRVPSELVEKEGQIIFYACEVTFMLRLFRVIDGRRVFDGSPVVIILATFRCAETP